MSLTLLDSPKNVKITTGSVITPTSGTGTTYQYELVSFGDARTELWASSSAPGKSVIESVIKDESAIIYFQNMQTCSSATQNVVGTRMWQIIKDYPSGIINKNGAVMQQVVIPYTGNDIDNGLSSDGQEAEGNGGQPLNWRCGLGSPRQGFRTSSKVGCGYISMSNGRTSADSSSYADRVYTVSPEDQGAFAMMLHFVGNPTIKATTEKPKVIIDINGGKGILVTSQTSDVLFTVNNNKTTGSLTVSDSGYNVPHIEGNSELKPVTIFFYPIYNGLVATSNISNSTKDESSLVGRCSNATYSPFNEMSPTIQEFPNKFAGNESTKISVDDSRKTRFNFGQIKLTWTNCWGNFCYCPIVFSKTTKFFYFFKGQYQGSKVGGIGGTWTYYAVPIFTDNHGSSEMSSNKYTATKLYDDDDNMYSVYYFTFSITGGSDNKPGQMFGFVKILKRTGAYSEVKNQDGTFSLTPSGAVVSTTKSGATSNWQDYITQVSTRVGLDGMSGSITLDKYAFYSDLSTTPVQTIGSISLNAINGPYGTSASVSNAYGLTGGLFFKGYALDISDSVSESSDTMTINLCGVDKKLEDMKLVNCPFWDGDKLFGSDNDRIIQYFKNYTGCALQFNSNFCPLGEDGYRVPASFNYQKPAVDFTLGTSCLEALRQLANMCNLQFIIQPNGKCYFYEMDDIGKPKWVGTGSSLNSYAATDIISMNINPYLENKYNTFLTMGYLVKKTPNGMVNPLEVSVNPGMIMDYVAPGGSNFPWSRIKSTAAPGYVTMSELQKFHNSNN